MKKRQAIPVDKVPVIFDDDCVQKLAYIRKLPSDADLGMYAKLIRNGVRAFAHGARVPSSNDLHQEIKALYNAALREKYDTVADLLENLSPATRDWLNERYQRRSLRGTTLPAAEDLRDPTHRKPALVVQLCSTGGKIIEGRRRPTGRRSRTFKPRLYAPEPRRHFPKREAELELVASLQIRDLHVTGCLPALTARHRSAHRPPGPFARMAQKVLDLAGTRADAVALINELNRRRREKEKQRRAHDDENDELRRSFFTQTGTPAGCVRRAPPPPVK
jgi:hypothetical protein